MPFSKSNALKKDVAFVFWSIVSLLAIINLFVFDLLLLLAPEKLQVQFMPDDAYYYLQLAKNFVKLGYWTFDSGSTVASGFHPLLAYVLALAYRLFRPDTRAFVLYDMTLASVLTLALVAWIWVKSFRQRKTVFLIFLTLFIGARSFLFNSISGVEWPLVVLLASAYCLIFYETTDFLPGSIGLFVIGFFLSLARTDSGLLPFGLFLASFLLSRSHSSKVQLSVRNAFMGLAGAVAGLALVFFHNYLFTGSFLQSSARMKYYWSQFGGSSWGMALSLPLRAAGFDFYFTSLYKWAAMIPFIYLYMLFSIILLQKRYLPAKFVLLTEDHQAFKRATLFVASLICVLGYVAVYRFDGVIQPWYTANFIVPLFILGVGTIGYFHETSRLRTLLITFVSFITLATFLFNVLWTYPVQIHAPWPHQQFLLQAGKYLSQNPLPGSVGAWNAGIIGYYQGGTVINIDGLVNNEIYPYAVHNNLPAYLEKKGIRYVVDFKVMFSSQFQQRGGYDNPLFLQRLEPLIAFDRGQFPPWQFLTIYQLSE